MTEPVEEDLNELYDLEVPRVDLVSKGANGMPFLIAKSAAGAGLIDADTIHRLLKSDPEAPVTAPASTDTEPVAKEGEDLDASQVLADPETTAPGSDTSPGSPAWEAVDAASARKWTAILARAKNALGTLADRENVEDATSDSGDPDAWYNAMNLNDAACAIDYAIGVLAPFAVSEQAEADLAVEGLELVGKSADAIDTAQLEVLEALGPVLKAGRTLSASNEAAIRGAVESLQAVLSSLPAAPDDTGAIAKQSLEDELAAALKTDTKAVVAVEKAKGDPQMAVYDANGKLVGTIDQADLNPIAAPAPPEGGDKPGQETTAGAETIPGTQTVQAPADTTAVAKSAADQLSDVLKEALTPLVEQLGIAELTSTVNGLRERVEKMAAQPDDRRSPLLNGSNGVGGPVHRDPPPADDALEPLKKAVEDATTPAERDRAKQELAYAMVRQRFQ